MRRNLALGVASLLLTLCAFELALRAVSFSELVGRSRIGTWQWTRYDPVLGYGNVPGFRLPEQDVAINALGFRGDEMSRRKPPGVVRVVCLGDSTTFGIWLDAPMVLRANAPYPREIERLARADGFRVEVVNAGVLGQTTSGGLVQLLTQILAIEPDVITVRFGNNDHGRRWRGDLTPLATDWEYAVLRALPIIAWRSELVRGLFHLYRRIAERFQSSQPRRVPQHRFEENLRRMIAIARERGIHIAFLDFPYRPLEQGGSVEAFPNVMQAVGSVEELYAVHDAYQDIVARVAADGGVPLIRTREALRADREHTFSDFDLSHPNALGSTIVAREVYAALRRLGWLGDPPERGPDALRGER